MIKNKEEIIQEKSAKILEQIRIYIDEMDALSETEEFTIDRIEKMWNELGNITNHVYQEINAEILGQIDEEKIIKIKKKNIYKKGYC